MILMALLSLVLNWCLYYLPNASPKFANIVNNVGSVLHLAETLGQLERQADLALVQVQTLTELLKVMLMY